MLLSCADCSRAASWSEQEKGCETLSSAIVKLKAEMDDLRSKYDSIETTPVDMVPKQK